MNLKNLSDEILLRNMDEIVRREREILIEVLHHLREIDKRRLYSDLCYQSLFDYAVHRLGYSEDQACRRINAMRLLREIPEIEDKISSGALSLTHIGMAQTLFKNELKNDNEVSREEKIEILNKLEHQPRRNAEKIVIERSTTPHVLVPDSIRAVSQNSIEIKFIAPEELKNKMDHLKGLLAHKFPYLSWAELFDHLCELGLDKYDRTRKKSRRTG